MTAAVLDLKLPKYFPSDLELPLPPEHKTWHTERLCPTLLAYALDTDRALFIAQLHHWLQYEDFGVYKHGWHWIWNTEWEWQEQFPWWSEDKTGHIRRSLEREGYVVSNNFSRTPLNRTKYSTLDYYKIALETGWNPLVLDLSRDYPHPPQFVKGQRQRGRHRSDQVELVYSDTEENPEPSLSDDSAKIQNLSRSDAKVDSVKNQLSTIYKKNSLSTKNRTDRIKRESDLCESVIPSGNQDSDGFDPWLDVDNDSQVVAEPPKSHSSKPESKGWDKYSAPVAGQFAKSEQQNKGQQTKPVKQVEMEREPYEWEIALNRPYDVFLRWWADRKYVPQGGRWEADALGNAYSEFYNNPHKVTAVIFPQFLEFMQQVASNQNQARFAGLKVILPSCFKVLPIPTHENVQQLMANIQVLIDDDAQVADRQEIATPSCNQSISFEQATDTSIAPLPELTPVEALPPANNPLTLEEQVKIKQIQWRNVPLLRGVITEWVNKTDCVVLGSNGPELAPSIDPGDKEPKSPTKSPEPLDPAPLAPPDEADSSKESAPDEAGTAQKTGLEPTVAKESGFNSTANEPDSDEYLEPPDPKDFTPPRGEPV